MHQGRRMRTDGMSSGCSPAPFKCCPTEASRGPSPVAMPPTPDDEVTTKLRVGGVLASMQGGTAPCTRLRDCLLPRPARGCRQGEARDSRGNRASLVVRIAVLDTDPTGPYVRAGADDAPPDLTSMSPGWPLATPREISLSSRRDGEGPPEVRAQTRDTCGQGGTPLSAQRSTSSAEGCRRRAPQLALEFRGNLRWASRARRAGLSASRSVGPRAPTAV